MPRFRDIFRRRTRLLKDDGEPEKTGKRNIFSRRLSTFAPIQTHDNGDITSLPLAIPLRTTSKPASRSASVRTSSQHTSTVTLPYPPGHRRSSGDAFPCNGHWLREQLAGERIESPQHPHTFFVPISVMTALLTIENLVNIIQDTDPCIGKDAIVYAHVACRRAIKLVATLIYIKKWDQICSMLDEGLTDNDLPFERRPNEQSRFTLLRQNGQPIKCMVEWKDKHLENFDRVQHWMTAPVFNKLEFHDLDKKTILPFVPLNDSNEKLAKKEGGYSEVYPVRIHPGHHGFWEISSTVEKEPLVAVKALFSSEEDEFSKEVTILKALGPKGHPHLIQLLATYKQYGRYHLLFPYADSNLRTYWEERPLPDFNRTNVLWSLRQMTGITHGLVHIHNFRQTVPLSCGSSNVWMPPGKWSTKLSVKGGEEWFGRHGDLKPENILWFNQDAKGENSMGVLQIADFGLGRFHGRDSRSNRNPDSISFSPTYEPPECKLRRPVSRMYDMWGLGCLILEFVTWLLKGSDAIEAFSEARGLYNPETQIDDDNFFTIIKNADGPKGTVREAVNVWVRDLHAHEKCSHLIHDLLDLTMKEMLVVDSKERSTAGWLYQRLHVYLSRSEIDEDYLLKSEPRVHKSSTGRINRMPAVLDMPTLTPKRNAATLSTKKTRLLPPPHKVLKPTHLPKDLVLRKVGTPGLNRIKTWPAG